MSPLTSKILISERQIYTTTLRDTFLPLSFPNVARKTLNKFNHNKGSQEIIHPLYTF
jgi:hypothetical protein